MADNLAVPAGVSVCLWLLLGKRNRRCGAEAKRGLAMSIGLFLLVVSILGLTPSFSDEPSSATAFRILISSSGFAIAIVLGLAANRYSGSETVGGWILVAIGMILLIYMFFSMLNVTGWPGRANAPAIGGASLSTKLLS